MKANTEKINFRKRCENFLTSNKFTIPFLIIISTFMLVTENIGQLLGFLGIGLILWATKWNWGSFGWFKKFNKRTISKALLVMASIIIIVDVILTPIIESLLAIPINLESFEGLRGNIIALIISIILMWIIAGIGEELLFRGFMMKKIALLLGDNNKSWLIGAIVSSLVFGFAHLYQGVSGIITAAAVAFILALAFLKNRENLLICILAHGFYDMFGLTMIYLGKESIITDFMQQYVFSL